MDFDVVMKRIILILLLPLLCFSCQDKQGSMLAEVVVYIEDSPADFQTLMIAIDRVEISNGTSWITLKSDTRPISMLDLTGGASLRLAKELLIKDNYNKMRFTFSDSRNVLTINNTEHTLSAKPDDLSLEFNIRWNASEEQTKVLMFDFDSALSVDTVTMSLTPRMTQVDIDTWGAVSGVISTRDNKAIAERMFLQVSSTVEPKTILYRGMTNPSNGNLFLRLPAGLYNVYIEPSAISVYKKDTLRDISVLSAEATILGAVVMPIRSAN